MMNIKWMWKNVKWIITSHNQKSNHFEKPHNSYGYFVLLPPNYLVGKYAKYIWHVEKIMVLSHDLTMFSCMFIIPHNFNY